MAPSDSAGCFSFYNPPRYLPAADAADAADAAAVARTDVECHQGK